MLKRVLSLVSLAGLLLVACDAAGWTADSGAALPPASSVSGTVVRGADGQIQVLDPTNSPRAGPRLCSPNTLCVGPGQTYSRLGAAVAAAREGDVIELNGGTYHEAVRLDRRNVTVRGIKGRPHIDCAGLRPVDDKACVLVSADGVTLENLEISGAEISENLGANAACVRNNGNASLTLRRVVCHSSQEGMLTSGGDIVIENSEFYDNGWTDLTHNIYVENCDLVIVRGSTFRDARVGHEFKSRCAETKISDSTFRSTKGSRDLDIPDGGRTLVERSTLVKTADAESQQIIGFTAEGCRYPADMVVRQVHIINSNPHAEIQNFNKCDRHTITLDGVTYEGDPVILMGAVVTR